MTTSAFVPVSVERGVMTISLNRPDKKNAINFEMYDAMTQALRDADRRDDVRVVLFHGLDDCFTAGNDLADFNAEALTDLPPAAKFLFTIHDLKKPIIAAVSGQAVGIGTTLLFHCDLVYAADTASFSLPFVNLGICPEAGSTLSLPALAGHTGASELLLFGEFFGAEDALHHKIINRILPAGELLDYAKDRAAQLAMRPSQAIIETKRFLKAGQKNAIHQRIHEELKVFMALLQTEESKSARAMVLNKS